MNKKITIAIDAMYGEILQIKQLKGKLIFK